MIMAVQLAFSYYCRLIDVRVVVVRDSGTMTVVMEAKEIFYNIIIGKYYLTIKVPLFFL